MWLATLVYAIIQASAGNMTWVGWTLFALITLLMIGGNIVDNIIIAKHMLDKQHPLELDPVVICRRDHR